MKQIFGMIYSQFLKLRGFVVSNSKTARRERQELEAERLDRIRNPSNYRFK